MLNVQLTDETATGIVTALLLQDLDMIRGDRKRMLESMSKETLDAGIRRIYEADVGHYTVLEAHMVAVLEYYGVPA